MLFYARARAYAIYIRKTLGGKRQNCGLPKAEALHIGVYILQEKKPEKKLKNFEIVVDKGASDAYNTNCSASFGAGKEP